MPSRFLNVRRSYMVGIPQGTGSSVEDVAAFRAEEVEKDSEIDENIEIVEMEKCDSDDVEGIESEVE
jgi:hypothetical protein